jgi:hypothetical protein
MWQPATRDRIDEAGGFHHAVAERLEAHSALIRSTASFLLNGWNGQASKEFDTFSSDLSGHYEVTASEARAVGSAGAGRSSAYVEPA